MGLWQRITSMFERKANRGHSAGTPRVIRARYDAAQITDENRRHWAMSDSLSAKQANSTGVREILRRHSRYETANNSYARGLVNSLADVVIGYGAVCHIPRPADATPAERKAARQISRLFAQWAEATGFWSKLWTMRVAKCVDGEAFAILRTNPRPRDPVTLDVQLIEAEQVTHGVAEIGVDPTRVDGVDLDDMGNPTAYHILPEHPGDAFLWQMDANMYSPRAVLHWYRVDRPGQVRGVPETTPALPLFAQLRRFTLATLTAAETAADFAAVIQSTLPPDEAEQTVPFEEIEITRGMYVTLPDGRTINQLKAEHPQTTYTMFKTEILMEIGRCLNWPRGLVLGDFSPYNYASGRLEMQGSTRTIDVDRYTCELQVLAKVFDAWFAEASLIPGYLPAIGRLQLTPRWFWRNLGHVDRKKEEDGRAAALANHTTTLLKECAADGEDWEDVLEQTAAEKAVLKELGLVAEPPPTNVATPQESNEDANQDEQTANA